MSGAFRKGFGFSALEPFIPILELVGGDGAHFGGTHVISPTVENRRSAGDAISGEWVVLKLMLNVILDFKLEVIDVGEFRIGTDFHGPGDGSGFVLGFKSNPVLATAQE